jgi:3-methyladenine DNA glycosylase AlkD
MTVEQVLAELKKHTNKKNLAGMARFGINTGKAFGISIPVIRALAKKIGKDHKLALELWKTEYHEARILCSMIAEPEKVTPALMNRWAKDFDSWDVCDQCCNNLFVYTPFSREKIYEWNDSPDEFVKRAAFVLMAVSAVHNKEWNDDDFVELLPIIKKHSVDSRNFVKKAVNWALRQIGKRNVNLNKIAIRFSENLFGNESKSGKWIAADALKELTNRKIQVRLKR